MKFIHLADLHIGKRVHGFSMLEDQRHILKHILDIVSAEQPDAVLIAGDVYDTAVPATEAVGVLDDFLVDLAQLGPQVLVISGNHDSPDRLSFGGRLMRRSGIHLAPAYRGQVAPITLQDAHGDVNIYMLPFIKPAHVRRWYPEEDIITYTDALRTAIEHMGVDTSARNVLLTHQFVTGAERSESEEVSVGGADNVDAAVFEAFDYVALGHLHRPQRAGGQHVRYGGSPLKYSFSESGHVKSLLVVDLQEKGSLQVKEVPLEARRDMREVKGSFTQVTDPACYIMENTDDYVRVTLTDEEDIPDAMGKLRMVYPNLMALRYDNTRTRQSRGPLDLGAPEKKAPLTLFEDLYMLQNNQPMSQEQRAFCQELMASLWEENA